MIWTGISNRLVRQKSRQDAPLLKDTQSYRARTAPRNYRERTHRNKQTLKSLKEAKREKSSKAKKPEAKKAGEQKSGKARRKKSKMEKLDPSSFLFSARERRANVTAVLADLLYRQVKLGLSFQLNLSVSLFFRLVWYNKKFGSINHLRQLQGASWTLSNVPWSAVRLYVIEPSWWNTSNEWEQQGSTSTDFWLHKKASK